jgi:hypothetical protein
MAERPLNDEMFWDVVVSIAADDKHLVSVLGGMLLNRATTEDADYSDMQEYLYHRYGLPSRACIDQVFTLCEERSLGLKT